MGTFPDFQEEKKLWKKGWSLVIGVDEVGRGAIAGPLVASAVALAPQISNVKFPISNEIIVDDSKRLSPSQREKAAKWIKKNCLAYGIGEVGVGTINRIGIGRASSMAMREAISQIITNKPILPISNKKMENGRWKMEIPERKIFVLVDAFHIKYLRGIGLKNQKAIIKGDQKSISIAAASIIAKVYRDTLMRRLSVRNSKYGWGANKGYGTKIHKQAILKNGITSLHRTQFIQTFLAS